MENPVEQAPIPADTSTFRLMVEDDLSRMVQLAHQFFDESELAEFATFSPENIHATFHGTLANPNFQVIVFAPEGQVEGFIAFMLEASYTYEPLALGYLFYVSPRYRRSPAGRQLQELAILYAKECGACAFYNGVMAGIDGVAKSLPNLYTKLGFEPLWWGRLILKET